MRIAVLLADTCMLLIICFQFCSLLYVETADRPGLLVDLVKIITDIDIAVESGEFDTEVYYIHHCTNYTEEEFNLVIIQNECVSI